MHSTSRAWLVHSTPLAKYAYLASHSSYMGPQDGTCRGISNGAAALRRRLPTPECTRTTRRSPATPRRRARGEPTTHSDNDTANALYSVVATSTNRQSAPQRRNKRTSPVNPLPGSEPAPATPNTEAHILYLSAMWDTARRQRRALRTGPRRTAQPRSQANLQMEDRRQSVAMGLYDAQQRRTRCTNPAAATSSAHY